MPDPAAADLPSESDPLVNHRILVIDDNPSIHEDYRKILLPVGGTTELADLEAELFGEASAPVPQRPAFELTSAMQGQDGHDMITEALLVGRPFALAFIDMRMPPGWDGMETTLRILTLDSDIQIVICTAYSDYSWEDMSRRLGATDRVLILKKPFDNVEVQQLSHAMTKKWLLNIQAGFKFAELEEMVKTRTKELSQANESLGMSEERFSKAFHSSPLPSGILSMPQRRFVGEATAPAFLDLTPLFSA